MNTQKNLIINHINYAMLRIKSFGKENPPCQAYGLFVNCDVCFFQAYSFQFLLIKIYMEFFFMQVQKMCFLKPIMRYDMKRVGQIQLYIYIDFFFSYTLSVFVCVQLAGILERCFFFHNFLFSRRGIFTFSSA